MPQLASDREQYSLDFSWIRQSLGSIREPDERLKDFEK